MKIEMRCPSCGRAYVIDSVKIPAGGSSVRCTACGAEIGVIAPAEPPAAPRSPAPTRPEAPPVGPSAEVVCPRCGLHFLPSVGTAPPSATRTILIVEDNPYFVEAARDALSGSYETKAVSSVAEALSVLASERIALVLLDLVLENGEDGLSLLRNLPRKPCPILLFTAQDESEMYGEGWERLRALGADDAVFKGMKMGETLIRKVASVLGEAEAPEDLRR